MTIDVSSLMERSLAMLTSDHASVVSMNLFVALLCACIVIGHLLEENRWMNESITALAIGLFTGVVILLTTNGKSSHLMVFSEDLFFIYLLPPIIFNAGTLRYFCLNSRGAVGVGGQAVGGNMTVLVTVLLRSIKKLGKASGGMRIEIWTDAQVFKPHQWNFQDSTVKFQVKKKQFFRNFITIMLFGAVGTLISFIIISLGAIHFFKEMNIGSLKIGDYLAIGAIFAATDSVCTLQVLNQDETPLLYSLVFGEGVVNDATSVVLFNAIQNFDLSHIDSSIALQFVGNFLYLFISSTLLGVIVGLLSAFTIKKLYMGRHSTDREVALMILMAYLSYMLAELFYLSGILTVFFCGIVMSHYTWHNVTESSRVTTKHAFATLSFVAEIFIFLYVGMDALDIEKWRVVSDSPGKSLKVSSILLGLVLVGRAAFVFPLSFLSNLTKKSPDEKIDFKQQITVWWAGLMRGAVSMALAYNQFTRFGHTKLHGNAIMITSTITVVLFSTVVFGLMTKPLIRILLPNSKQLTRMVSSEPSTPKSFTVPFLVNGHDQESNYKNETITRPTSLRLLFTTTSHTVHRYWRTFDDAFMRPVFGGRGFVPVVPGSPLEQSVPQWH